MPAAHPARRRLPAWPACAALAALLLVALAPLLHAQTKAKRPNVVLIMSDDMGFSDLGCYGGEIRTPSLDRLAERGLRFTQFYNGARCCPTRAALLTGLYAHQAGIGHMMDDRGHDGYRGDLNRNCVTIAEALRPAGYATYMTGKWHVTRHTPPRDSEPKKHNWPLQRGFDRFYGTIHGGGSFYDPVSLTRDNTLISAYADPEYRPEQYYYTDAVSDQAARFVREHRGRAGEKPFFLYVAYTAAHWPMQALERHVAKYRGKYDGGYEPVRRARSERVKRLGLVDPQTALAAQAGDWSKVEHRAWEVRNMEVYAAMVDAMDQGIGRLVRELERHGELDNTLILYLQDNGGCAEVMGRAAQGEYARRPEKPPFPAMPKEALQPLMVPKQTRDGFPVVMGPGVMPGGPDSFIAYGEGWANVSNTPFREYKHWVHEGGISTPLITHWPEGIRRPGRLVADPAHLIDVMATCVDLGEATYPKEVGGQPIHSLEGISLRPALAAQPLRRSQPLFWEHEGNRAVRAGRWKLVAKENQPWELYDLPADRTEQRDLAATHPEKVKELAAQWDAWAARANVLPLGTWRARAPQARGE